MQFIDQYDPTFFAELSADVYDCFSDEVLALPDAAPPLDTVWNNLANQPQFSGAPLHSAKDIVTLGDGSASTVLNEIDTGRAGALRRATRCACSTASRPATIRYFVVREPDFFQNLDPDVLTQALAGCAQARAGRRAWRAARRHADDAAARLPAAISRPPPQSLASRYDQQRPARRPERPAAQRRLGQTIGDFLSVELDSADDFFRFFPDAAKFLNSFFDSAQGVAFAPNLFGSLTLDDMNYMVAARPEPAQQPARSKRCNCSRRMWSLGCRRTCRIGSRRVQRRSCRPTT